MNPETAFPEAAHFSHEAMHTVFHLWLRGTSASGAAGIARVCWEKIDDLEACLSRHIETSDIARINRLTENETLYLNGDCHRCLLLGVEAHAATGGLFDITLGAGIRHRQSAGNEPAPAPAGQLIIHPDVPAVTCIAPGREIDLGGIGKGFALDLVRPLLQDWGAEDAMIAAGASSMLAFGPTAWPVELAGSGQAREVLLANQALSASGILMQGRHILHPNGESFLPARPPSAAWVVASSATVAEVASTTLMLVEDGEAVEILSRLNGVSAAFVEHDGIITRLSGPLETP